jgi:hypothetical protein
MAFVAQCGKIATIGRSRIAIVRPPAALKQRQTCLAANNSGRDRFYAAAFRATQAQKSRRKVAFPPAKIFGVRSAKA